MSRHYFLGIDIGTSSSKGVLVGPEGEIVARASIAHSLSIPRPGFAEHDADEVWWADFVHLCRELLACSKVPPHAIKAVGHSAISPCLLCADREGKPLGPAILYGIDVRAAQQQQEIYQFIGEENIYDLSGIGLSSQSVTPKIRWLQQHQQEIWRQAYFLFSASGYITYRLTDRYCLDVYDTVGYPGLFDYRKIEWSSRYREWLCGDKLLPKLLWSADLAGEVTSAAAVETGLHPGTPVLPGCADAAAEAVSAGLSKVGDTMMMYGSSAFFF